MDEKSLICPVAKVRKVSQWLHSMPSTFVYGFLGNSSL